MYFCSKQNYSYICNVLRDEAYKPFKRLNNKFVIDMHFGTGEIILIVLVVLLLFGGKKIPELMKGLGKGVRSFKDGLNGVNEDEKENKKESTNEA